MSNSQLDRCLIVKYTVAVITVVCCLPRSYVDRVAEVDVYTARMYCIVYSMPYISLYRTILLQAKITSTVLCSITFITDFA